MDIKEILFELSRRDALGGIDIRSLPARAVTVHGKEKIPAVFCATPPHLSAGETEYSDISKINSAEKEIKEDEERQISVLEKEKDDLRKQTNKDKTTLQKRIDDLQNQYDV